MRKLICILLPFLFLCFSCSQDTPDEGGTFPTKDYSSLIKENTYVIPASVDAITVFNLFYNKYGYGDFNITGNAIHTETAILNGQKIENSITCNILKIKVYCIDNSTKGFHGSAFYTDFYNDKNEVLSYCYEWNYRNTHGLNKKVSNWNNTPVWDITIAK